MIDKILICDIVIWQNLICQYSSILNIASESEVKLANKAEIKRYNAVNKRKKRN